MRVVLSGSTGFVGRALVLRLTRDGHEIRALTRSPSSAVAKLGTGVTIVDNNDAKAVDTAIEDSDAIINLAGEPVTEGRWTESRKRKLRASRIDTTRTLIEAARRTGAKIGVFISASAVGIYGDSGDTVIDETRAVASDFLAQLCVAWEGAALEARTLGARVALMRIGIVLGSGGGALAKMLPLFRTGLGGNLGSGRQWVSWIHLHDVVEALAASLTDDRYDGVFNCVAPHAVTNAKLTRTLGELLHRPTVMTAPAFALKLALGGAASAILASQRALPARLQALEFAFQFAHLDAALHQII